MSENKNVTKSLDAGIDVINAGGFEKDQMQAVVAKDSDWLIEKLQGDSVTDDEFFKAWTTGSNHQEKRFFLIDSYSPELFEETVDRSRAAMLKSPCDQSNGGFDGDISKFLSIKHLPISPTDSNINGQEVQIDAFGNQAEFIQDGLSVFLSDSYSPGLSELDPNFDGDELERALCDLKHSKQFVPEIALAHLMKKQEMVVVSTPIVDQCSSAVLASKHGNNPAVVDPQNLYRSEYLFGTSADVCFQKAPSNVEDAALDNDIHIATFGNQAEIVMTSDAIRRRIPSRVLLQKAPKWFVHRATVGWAGLRINGLLKRKCKKGARKHYSKKIN
jgi:hypothetical protein